MNIKLKDIKTAPWNTRGEITEESVKELADTIKEQGLINPITVWKHGKEWLCIAGNRRLAALLSLGEKETDATEFKGTEHEAKMVTITENLQREDVSPIEEANLIEQCLEDGMTAEAIAAKTARSVSWVNRRKRLIGLCDAFKDVSDKFTTDQLEKIASFDPVVQTRVLEGLDLDEEGWEEVKYALERESKDLANAKFDTKACQKCLKRTGAQADLWGVCDGCLGQCQDRSCFEQKIKDAQEAEIAELTKGAKEIVRVSGYWEMPSDSESTPKMDKKHPCAYVQIEWNGEIVVKWGESKKARDERAKKEEERREAERAEERAASARQDGIVDALDAWKDGKGGGDDCLVGLDDILENEVGKNLDDTCRKFVVSAVKDTIDGWNNVYGWMRILRAFPAIAKLAGVSEDDVQYLFDNNQEENED